MDIEMVKFGDVFRYNEKEYVFLAKFEDIMYAAQILNSEYSEEFKRVYNTHKRLGKPTDKPIFCFVILETKMFQKRIAHLAGAENNELPLDDSVCTLDAVDIKELLEMIKDKSSPIPTKLRDLIKDISL